MTNQTASLLAGFLQSVRLYPGRPALHVDGREYTYSELDRMARGLAALLDREDPSGPGGLTGVFAYRSLTAFVGVLAALMRGHGYVPLNRMFPDVRTSTMLSRAGCRSIIVDGPSAAHLQDVLAGQEPIRVVVHGMENADSDGAATIAGHKVVRYREEVAPDSWAPRFAHGDSIAYLLFTSGSTGIPKGVGVNHANVTSFLAGIRNRYDFTSTDRFSQTFDMTFDLSVFDMFVAWGCGGCVCCPSQKSLINPGRFIRDNRISVWFSVPSTGVFMRRLGALKPDRYPELRWSLFCGEPLPAEVARAWQEAAPNSKVENLYGPTEATIACMVYRWDPALSPQECVNGIVPIGEPFGETSVTVCNSELSQVPAGAEGELLLGGPQVTAGYWRDEEKTAAAFVSPFGDGRIHYRTGDRVRRPKRQKPMVYLGRIDNQIKIHGHRVELGEIEAVLRDIMDCDAVIALGWPLSESGAGGIVAFAAAPDADVVDVLQHARNRLPEYMVPRALYLRDELPLNVNGKFDRKALLKEMEDPR